MIKKWICFAFLASSFLTVTLQAETGFGRSDYGEAVFDKLKIYGSAALNGTRVENKAKVMGNLNATNAHIGTLIVYGRAKLENSLIDHNTEVYGYLKGVTSEFKGSVDVWSKKVVLENSTVKNLTIHGINLPFEYQEVHLKDGSVVEGDIIFLASEGTVVKDSSSKIKGEVKGGVVKTK